MKTEYYFAATLKTLMAEVPLDDISVTLLAKKCRVNRQTFYYHFHDIYDLLTLVYLNEKMEGIENALTIKDMVKCIYNYYANHKAFVLATLDSACKDLFQEFIYNNCYKFCLHIINNDLESKKITANDRKSIARYYAMAFSNSLVYYLSNYKNKTIEGMMNALCYEDESNIKRSITKFIKIRGKND